MALIEVARFSELHEGHIAAGALEASGIVAWFPGHGWGAVDWTMRQATGGFPLYVDEAAAVDAHQFLAEIRKPDPEALQWLRHPALVTGLPVALVSALSPVLGMTIAAGRSGPGWRAVAAVLVAVLLAGLLISIVATAMMLAEY